MPATESTWYNQKLLHVIFGCTAFILLVSTIWMIAADSEREWKGYQIKARQMDLTQIAWRKKAEIATQAEVVRQRQRELDLARSALPNRETIEAFNQIANEDPEVFGDTTSQTNQINDLYSELSSAQNQGSSDKVTAALAQLEQARSALAIATEADRPTATASVEQATQALEVAETELSRDQESAIAIRNDLLKVANKIEKKAKFLMDEALITKKMAAARFDAVRAAQGLLIRDGKNEEAATKQAEVDQAKSDLDQATLNQQKFSDHRNRLRKVLLQITADQDASQKALDEAQGEATRLETALSDGTISYFTSTFPYLGKKWLTQPVGDAFGSPLKIDNQWTKGLTMPNGSFGEVRRFDRCTTCHRGIDKTAPGSAVDPAYEGRHEVVLQLSTPDTKPSDDADPAEVYGLTFAEKGLVDADDVTVEFVAPRSRAAKAANITDSACVAGLRLGDVVRFIGGDRVDTPEEANQFLSRVTKWGEPVEIVVERGMPEPYSSHPRLDLYVGSLSPHKSTVFGCTVCHEGQGGGTSFNYASHTPNSNEQEHEWWKKYGWFNNHHWIFPMHPARFAESSCLKCHHDVVELGPSERFPEPPAPQLMAGFNLIHAYGCYGCHEINGYKGPDRIGPDMRLEPNYFAAAAELLHDPSFQKLPSQVHDLAKELVARPEDDQVRHQLLTEIQKNSIAETPTLAANAKGLTEVLADVERPGTLRKAGPSLRYVADKLGPSFLYDWIREPKHFRPDTKMPQFFGLWNHLEGDEASLEKAKRLEPVEITGIVQYLLKRSQTWKGVEPADGCEPADAERGKLAFETRGCLACHTHNSFDPATLGEIPSQPRLGVSRQKQGPDLSNLSDKFKLADNPDAKKWLYSWIRNPQGYHARTKMPDLFLLPVAQADGTQVDPAADIVSFLLDGQTDWEPDQPQLTVDPVALKELALEYLSKAFFSVQAEQYLANGIPSELGDTLKGAEVELLADRPGSMTEKLVLYVGNKSIGKYGCYGCHDVPGFEGAKPIGVALADWGRKEASKIAFEHIAEYIAHGHGGGHGGGHSRGHDGSPSSTTHSTDGVHAAETAAHDPTGSPTPSAGEPFDESFYMHRLEHHDRTGFIWQKLKEPRSYDFERAHNKDYNERLRMPQFPFTSEQREQVVTFVLGLVAEPPASQFVYQPDARAEALIAGQKVLDKFNCAACHILETEKWKLEFDPGTFEPPIVDNTTYPFMNAELPVHTLKGSAIPSGQHGTLTATVEGMPTITHPDRSDNARQLLFGYDAEAEEWFPVEHGDPLDPKLFRRSLTLWKPGAVEGQAMQVGQILDVANANLKKRYLANGGDLTLRLLPRVLEIERTANSQAKGSETWGWLPPSLHEEGTKVQPAWLHSFLLSPHPIRPASFMRMPRFNMSSDEASAIVNYFAARDQATYPYEYVEETQENKLAERNSAYAAQPEVSPRDVGPQPRFDDAMRIVTFKSYCVSCHVVGDYAPDGSVRAKAPNLENVYKRLRRDYVHRWVAKPARLLPYTPMPAVIPYQGKPEELIPKTMYHGEPVEQLEAVVDLLMNLDRYAASKNQVKPWEIPGAPATPPAAAANRPVPNREPGSNDQANRPRLPNGSQLTSPEQSPDRLANVADAP